MDEQKIITLTDREKCRLRMPVFFGSFDSRDMTFIETLMNARDELVNHCDWNGEIIVTLSDDCFTLSVEDNGRGIPLSQKDENGEYNYIKLFETLFAGCNFENSFSDNNIEAIGQNGIGATCTAYNSVYYQAIEYKDDIAREITYTDGCLNREYREYPSNKKHGTKITFTLDNTTFTNVKFDPEYIRSYIKKIASTTTNKTYIFNHLNHTDSFIYNNIEEYFESIVQNQISNVIHFQEKNYDINNQKEGREFIEKDRIEVLLSLSTEPVQETYLNGGYLEENGTFYMGIIDGIRKYFQKYADKKVKLTTQDIEMSFNIYGTMGSNNPVYSNQTKKAASNELYKKLASDYIISNMEIFKAESPKEFDTILKHLCQINAFNQKNENSIKKIKKELSEKATTMLTRPKKLVPCRCKDPKKISIKLLEGDSALNICKQARDAETMMIMPLKGKPINAMKCTLDKLLENQEVIDMYKVFGCGITYKGKSIKGFDKFNLDNLNVNMISLLCDRDEDGGHLETLALGILHTLSPKLIEKGHVEIIQTPLYIITTKNEKLYAYSEIERVNIISKLKVPYKEVRYKGIGGLPVDVMHMALAEDTKKSIIITMKDAKRCADKLELFLSNDVDSRRKYIEEHGDKYVTDDVYI